MTASSDSKDLEREIRRLENIVQNLRTENTKMKIILEQHGLADVKVGDAEAICVEQLRMLKDESAVRPLIEQEVKMLDVLFKNLRIARGLESDKKDKRLKEMSTDDLKKMLEGFKS